MMIEENTENVGVVDQTLQAMAKAVSTGDLEKWRSLWHPEAQEFAPNTPAVVGLSNLLYKAKGWFELWTHDMVIRCEEIRVTEEWAFASGGLTLRSVSRREEKTHLLTGRFLAILIDDGRGRWLIYRFCYNSSVPLAGDP
jgi:ketosteroid isomerase-like protein